MTKTKLSKKKKLSKVLTKIKVGNKKINKYTKAQQNRKN